MGVVHYYTVNVFFSSVPEGFGSKSDYIILDMHSQI
jgi:hypothetical protein